MISIRSNIADVRRRMFAFERTQLPFATANTVTALAFEVRQEIVGPLWRRSFPTHRNPAFPSAVMRVDRATKAKPVARVHNDAHPREFLDRQARGGIKTPHSGRSVSVPSDPLKRSRTAHGMPKALKPRTVLGSNKAFIIDKGAKRLIVRRVGKARKALQVMYLLAHAARIKKRYPVYETAELVVKNKFGRVFHEQFERAMRTARR